MTSRKSSVAPAQRRVSRQRRNGVLFGMLVLAMLLIIVRIASLGRADTARQVQQATGPVRIASGSVPASAERYGRAWGPVDAPITIIEYVDYACESCAYFATTYEHEVIAAFAHTGDVRFELRNAPFHGEDAARAARGAACAAEQNRFWAFHDSLFLNQPTHGAAGFDLPLLQRIAAEIGADPVQLTTCIRSDAMIQQIQQDLDDSRAAGITGTPTFIVNGHTVVGPQSVDDFRRLFASLAPNVVIE